jgi:hypothetical protein
MINDSALIRGSIGDKFEYYSVAVDYVGNREAAPPGFDAQIVVADPNGVADQTRVPGFDVIPNPFGSAFDLVINGSESTTVTISVRDLAGRQVLGTSANLHQGNNTVRVVMPATASNGLYILRVEVGGHSQEMKLVMQ